MPSLLDRLEAAKAAAKEVRTAAATALGKNAEEALSPLERLRVYPWLFEDVPAGDQTAEMAGVVVRYDGMLLRHVTHALLTPEICMDAVLQNGMALQHVPEPLRTAEICLAAVQQDSLALQFVPAPVLAPEICLAAVQQDGRLLQLVPEPQRTPEICLEAVLQNSAQLQLVPAMALTDPAFARPLLDHVELRWDSIESYIGRPAMNAFLLRLDEAMQAWPRDEARDRS